MTPEERKVFEQMRELLESVQDDYKYRGVDTYDQIAAALAAANALDHIADASKMVSTGHYKMVPVEPTPEIIAAAAIAVWPVASIEDIEMARKAAPIVLMQYDLGHATTVESLAAALATMAPAYRAMIAEAPEQAGKDGV